MFSFTPADDILTEREAAIRAAHAAMAALREADEVEEDDDSEDEDAEAWARQLLSTLPSRSTHL